MSFIFLVIVSCIVIWRLVKIAKMMATQDFVVGLLSLIAFVFFCRFWWNGLNVIDSVLIFSKTAVISFGMVVSGTYFMRCKLGKLTEDEVKIFRKIGKYTLIAGLLLSAKDIVESFFRIIGVLIFGFSGDLIFTMIFFGAVPCAVLVWLTYFVKKIDILKNRRIEVQGPWATVSGVLMFIMLGGIAFYMTDGRIGGIVLILSVLPGIILMHYFKPFRVPWFILLNVLMLGLVVAKIDQGIAGNDGVATNISDSGNDMSVLGAFTGATVTSFDDVSTTDGVNGESFISTHNDDISFEAPINTTNDTSAITIEMNNNNVTPSESLTVSSMDGKDSITLQDNKIFDKTNMQVGTYGMDVSNDNIAFKDNAGNNLGSIDPSTGFTYDENGRHSGSVQDLGAVTTYTDADGHQAYKINLDGAAVVDSKTGEPIATVKKN